MNADEGQRRLAAILAADVAGYSRLMAHDDRATVRTLTEYREVFSERVVAHQGRIVDTAGDSVLATFDSVVEAVEAAMDVQRELAKRNEPLPDHRRMRFRIGVNLGDIILREDGTVYGDGVNVAARLEGLAEPGGVMVSESAHMQVEGKLGLSLADAGEHEVKNIPKPVRAFRVLDEGEVAPAVRVKLLPRIAIGIGAAVISLIIGAGTWWFFLYAPQETMLTVDGKITDDPVLAMPTGPSIAVLPFDNLSGDPEQNYFVVGLTEQLTAGLARFQSIQVIARNSTSKYAGQSVDIRDVGRDLGATYVLEGSVRRDKSTVRITAQLIDAANGAHVWSETYERDLSAASIFAIQDEITAQIASIIAGHSGVIARQLVGAAAGRRTDDLAAFECVLLAYKYDRVVSEDNYRAARGCLEKAIERAPDYAEALGALSYIYADGYTMGLAEEDPSIDFLAEAYRLAFRAVELDPTSATVQTQLAMAYFYNGELDGFNQHAERAMALNPHDPTTLGLLGTIMGFAGDYARAGPIVRKAFALNADLPYWYKFTFAGEHYWNKDWEAGRVLMERLDTTDDNPHTHIWHLLFLGELGLRDRATEILARLRTIIPNFSVAEFRINWAQWNVPAEKLERYATSMRKAGVPEASPKPIRRVVAVLPFDNMSGDPKHEYFADGFTDTLITDLSKLWKLGVIARNSTFTYKGRSIDVREVGKELGATHVVEGAVLRTDRRLRVNVQLIDAATGEHVWAERFDRPSKDIFDVQDEIVRAVISELDVVLASGEQARVWRRSTSSPEAYDIFLKATDVQRRMTKANAARAQELLREALDVDPKFAAAMSLLGNTYYNQAVAGWSASQSDSLDAAERSFLQAIELDDSLGGAYGMLGVVYLVKLDHEKALKYAAQAIEVTPGAADSLAYASVVYIYTGMPERGLQLINKATEFDPFPQAWFDHPKGAARIFLGDFDEAVTHYRSCLKKIPDYIWCNVNIIVPYMELGMLKEGRAQAREVLRIYPAFNTETAVQVMRIKDPTTREHWRKLLRQAGLP